MLARLLALFLLTPVVELVLLLQVGEWIGFLPTVALIVVTGVTGTYLARREGLSAWRRFQQRLDGGGLPGRELLDGVIILVAGALLITPGVLTDVVGILGLLPFTRSLIRKQVMRRVQAAMERGTLRMGFGGVGATSGNGGTAPDPASPAEDTWTGEATDVPRYRRQEERPGGDA